MKRDYKNLTFKLTDKDNGKLSTDIDKIVQIEKSKKNESGKHPIKSK